MAGRNQSNSPARWISKSARFPLDALKYSVNEPIITGVLLYALTRGPAHIRERVNNLFRHKIFVRGGGYATISNLITLLKVLTALGLLRRVNQALTRLALNNWILGRPGAPFDFREGKNELIVITGGSSGFGYEMVKGFSQKARLVVLDISPFPEEVARLPDVHFYRCDVTDNESVQRVCEEIRQTHGNPSVLINNAGIGTGKTVLETTNEQCEKLFKVNLLCHFVLIREFLPGMLQMKKGHIVTIASMASFVAAPGLLDYCCSKVGALYLNDGIRAECLTRYPGGEGIRTTSVHPSWHSTGIVKNFEKTLNKYGIYPDPASNVSDLVVEQVLKCRSGRIHVPLSMEGRANMRSWPLWMQDLAMGYVWKRDGFGFGRDSKSTIQ